MTNDQKTTAQIVITVEKEEARNLPACSPEKLCGIIRYIGILLEMQKVLCLEAGKINSYFRSFLEGIAFALPDDSLIMKLMNAAIEKADAQFGNENQYSSKIMEKLTDPDVTRPLSITFSIDL